MQDVVNPHKANGVPYTKIYKNHIKDQFHISYSCFNEWIGIPAKRQLEKLLAEKEQQKKIEKAQLRLFED